MYFCALWNLTNIPNNTKDQISIQSIFPFKGLYFLKKERYTFKNTLGNFLVGKKHG